MFDNSKIELAKISEERAVKIFKYAGLNAAINNSENELNIDLTVNGKEVDVQYSFDFKKYGDIRIDLISYLESKNKGIFLEHLAKRCSKELPSKGIKIKFGKYFDNNNMDGVLFFIYNGKKKNKIKEFEDQKIDYIVYLPKKIIINEIVNNINNYLKKIKWNDKKKHGIEDNYLSAFIPINLFQLSKKYKIPIIKNRSDIVHLNKQFKGNYQNPIGNKPK